MRKWGTSAEMCKMKNSETATGNDRDRSMRQEIQMTLKRLARDLKEN